MFDIRMAGKLYAVDVCDSKQKYGDDQMAWVNTALLRIIINNTNVLDNQKEGIIHECLELINMHYSLDLSHQTISTLGECMYHLVQQWPMIEANMEKEHGTR